MITIQLARGNIARLLSLTLPLLALTFFALPPLICACPISNEEQSATSSFNPPKPSSNHHFKFKQKINPVWWFGNADDPVAPSWYLPGKHNRNLAWHFRNPFHNFDAYVIGIADKSFTRTGRFPHDVFNPNGGWNWALCHHKGLPLPFIAYERKPVSFYLGWRDRGNFGIKLNLAAKKHPPSATMAPNT